MRVDCVCVSSLVDGVGLFSWVLLSAYQIIAYHSELTGHFANQWLVRGSVQY